MSGLIVFLRGVRFGVQVSLYRLCGGAHLGGDVVDAGSGFPLRPRRRSV
ncbi:hypothetical protein [Arthrobacter sp. 1088]|nr:hypothetical protein [Arthrobacter sp. 1088]